MPSLADDEAPALKVFASVLPVQTFVDAVGGERVDTEVMVRPGQSPATYDPSPKQVAALAEADLYVRVGVPFEDAWMKRIQAANPGMSILDLRDGLPLRTLEAHDHGHDHAHDQAHPDQDAEAMDPHIWTSPPLVRAMATALRERLSALDPEGAALYARNQQRFDAELQALHEALEARLAELDQRAFLVYHPAWGYFADTYDLEQIPIERAGKEPGPRRLSALIEQAQATGARAIFVQPEFDQRAAQQIARSIGGRVESATPLAGDYAANLRRFARILVEADPMSNRSTDDE
jgi:zinc transport system substrate-binding protein